MKKILRDTCILASLMILAVFAISIIWSGVTDEIKLILQLFLLALMISVINNLFDDYLTLSVIMSYVVKYFAISNTLSLHDALPICFIQVISGWHLSMLERCLSWHIFLTAS